tara:strand:- start:43 stop:219 length:177 start_codon:yes stop_codon:yes gene_type:complete
MSKITPAKAQSSAKMRGDNAKGIYPCKKELRADKKKPKKALGITTKAVSPSGSIDGQV